jgi:hypothetical protein
MVYMMGGRESPDFLTFQNYCTQAYNLVRKNGPLIISLFILMITSGMPELSNIEDIYYLTNMLSLDLSE